MKTIDDIEKLMKENKIAQADAAANGLAECDPDNVLQLSAADVELIERHVERMERLSDGARERPLCLYGCPPEDF